MALYRSFSGHSSQPQAPAARKRSINCRAVAVPLIVASALILGGCGAPSTTTTTTTRAIDLPLKAKIDDVATSLSFSADGAWLATGYTDVKLWDLTSLATPRLSFTGHRMSSGATPVLSANGLWMAVPSGPIERDVVVYNLKTAGLPVLETTIAGQEAEQQLSVALSGDGSMLVMQESDNLANVYNLTNPSSPAMILTKAGSRIVSLSLSTSGEVLAIGRWSTDSQVLNVMTPEHIVDSPQTKWTNMVVSADGSLLASWWDTGAEVRALSPEKASPCSGGAFNWPESSTHITPGKMALSGDGAWVAMWVYDAASLNYEVHLYEVMGDPCSLEIRKVLSGFQQVTALAFSGNGPLLAIACSEGILIHSLLPITSTTSTTSTTTTTSTTSTTTTTSTTRTTTTTAPASTSTSTFSTTTTSISTGPSAGPSVLVM